MLDFNEDMEPLAISELGIGTDVPIFLEGPGLEAVESEPVADMVEERAEAEVEKALVERPASWAARKAMEDASQVHSWLFLSGQMAASNLECLQALGVTHVLNCCERIPCKFKARLRYRVLPVMDTKASDIRKYIPDALSFLDEVLEARGKVLVHCMVGASRSVALVLAWLVARERVPLREAFKQLRAVRRPARPNRSFCQQLMDFEQEELGTCSATLADFFHT